MTHQSVKFSTKGVAFEFMSAVNSLAARGQINTSTYAVLKDLAQNYVTGTGTLTGFMNKALGISKVTNSFKNYASVYNGTRSLLTESFIEPIPMIEVLVESDTFT